MKNPLLTIVLFALFCASIFSQEEKLEVQGAIQISNSEDPSPDPGTIRWNDLTQDFEGYTGSEWKSLTKKEKFWGVMPNCTNTENSKITAADADTSDWFGSSVSISGNYAIVGVPFDDDSGDHSGSVYIFKRAETSWTQQAKLTANDATTGDIFGESVSIYGDYAIIGAPHDDDDGSYSGSAYVFMRSDTSWTQQAKLTADDAEAEDYFGESVSIYGDYAIVSARLDDDGGSRSGSAYIFKRTDTSWTQQAKLTADDAEADDEFGKSVAISGNYAIVGADYDDHGVTNSGSAYVFFRSGTAWTQQTRLNASDLSGYHRFGHDVSISGNYAIVGAYGDDHAGALSGAAYVFFRSGTAWTQQAKLTADDAETDDRFGYCVSISGDCAIVGALWSDDGGSNSGSAYIFMRSGSTWTQQAKLTASDAEGDDRFGLSVSISTDYAIVGSGGDDDDGSESGSAYIFE